MKFFTKSSNITPNTTAENATSNNTDNASDETMQIDRNDMAFQQLVRKEAKALRLKEQILTPPHQARLEDTLRLNETKMVNLEENLDRVRKQQERVHRFQELSMEMREQKAHLYEISKQKAGNVKEEEELARFEEFENIQGCFQRLTVLETQRREQKQHLSELSRMQDTMCKEVEEEQKRLAEQRDEMADAHRQMNACMDAMNEALQIEGRSAYIAILNTRCDERHKTLISQQTALEKEIQEQKSALASIEDKTEKVRMRRQSLLPHQRMARHGEVILEHLARLTEMETELSHAEQVLKESQKKESESNEQLERVYTNYQDIEQDIQALKDELKVHRDNNHGLESYRLQERAMELQLRRAMLLSAQSLWNRIAEGYTRIEDVLQSINSLRLKEDNLKGNIETTEKELNILRRTCHEKEYTYTLSKSQNVIQLRSDLKEGTSCTVCGATHHPYHSDTMLEQNKLIGEFKTDFESMAAELRSKEQTLRNMEKEFAATSAKKEEEENKLIMLRELQNGYTHDWIMYSRLDSTFEKCDSSVNAMARTAMLRQLIENIEIEVDVAKKELDTFNFHQKRINELSEQINTHERTRTDILTRLNEVNTGCQVMAALLDNAQSQKQKYSDAYTRLFDRLDKMISIPDWTTTWKRSHEALILRIQEVTKEWNELEEQLVQVEHNLSAEKQKLDFLQQQMQALAMLITLIEDDKQDCQERIAEDAEKLERLIGNTSSKQYLAQSIKAFQDKQQRHDKQNETTQTCRLRLQEIKGRMEEHLEYATTTDQRTTEEHQKLDIWIRQYNANHPPVQYSELEKIFETDRNWNELRTRLRSLQMDLLLTQSRVDKLGSLIIALQSEGTVNDNDIDLVQHQLATQIETLENRRRDTMMQIATATLQLQAHKKAEESIKEDKMREE